MRDFGPDHRWLSINTATVKRQQGADWPLPAILDACAGRGIRAVSPWRDQVADAGLQATARQLKALDIELSGYCRGGMFTAAGARDDNLRALDEACTLGAPCLVLVVGGGGRDIVTARAQVLDGIARLLEAARERSMPLAIEPLHPMYAADRACINTLEQALDVCDALDPGRRGALGVAVDVYHLWWDPKLASQIQRAGADRLLAFHVCDWLDPTVDLLEDRGMPGDGVIDIRGIRTLVEDQGYAGYAEVEVFSARNWWKKSGGQVLDTCIERHRSVV